MSAVAAKMYSPKAVHKATVRRRLIDTASRFKRSRDEEIVEHLTGALHSMWSDGLIPFSKADLRTMLFTVGRDEYGMVVHMPELLKRWLDEVS